MAAIKSFTSLEQSKKLAEILPLESADLWWNESKNYPEFIKTYHEYLSVSIPPIPCWSLAALRNLLPPAIKPNNDSYLFESHNTFDNSWVYRYYNEDGASYLYCKDINEVDACVDMIEKLHELKML